ncbi:cell division protein FtsQ/DivIB [Algoriphagus sp. NF]|jgi:cell division protein FtsQ|uniref:Cell division protein FtsQ/DivIB n=1 Tax=Algoriphagus marincola TaxID=264027 RepID=A0ABS7N4E3_9BACT|nr:MULTISPECIES: cell division protein FtsQ/DivIB [Algoriphagus]MBY5951198.1 cell division protein FtsQ/DivIB [Algoriphagus marincola]MDE0559346.1 cell division protein FtsQ/DivIB [Algoriphagus sp. NF]
MKRLKKYGVFVILTLILGGFIAFVEKQSIYKTYQGTEIEIEGVSGLYFVDKQEIETLLAEAFPNLKVGLLLEEVPLNAIEDRLEGHPFIKLADASIGQKGILQLYLEQHQPIARIVRPLAADGYITTEGKIIPISSSYTSRVLILSGDMAEKLLNEGGVMNQMPELMDLIRFISEDEFWNAQITEVEIRERDDIRLYQQVGEQVIELGDAADLEDKFDRIQIFYSEILPRKGWDAYDRVSVKFKEQIVCE